MIPDIKVPEHIEQKVQEVIRSYGKYQASLEARYLRHGYSLAAAELEAKDKEIERLKREASIDRDECTGVVEASDLENHRLRREIERLKGLIDKA